MRTLIIYVSFHHKNTEKIANELGEALDADVLPIMEVNPAEIPDYDLIGFGSGIYFGGYHRGLIEFIDHIPPGEGKPSFIFHTSGSKMMMSQKITGMMFTEKIRTHLAKNGYDVLGEFGCLGWDTYGPFRLVGGVARGHPNKKDLKDARIFAEELKSALEGEL